MDDAREVWFYSGHLDCDLEFRGQRILTNPRSVQITAVGVYLEIEHFVCIINTVLKRATSISPLLRFGTSQLDSL